MLGFAQLEAAEAVLSFCDSTDPVLGASLLTHPGPSFKHRYLCAGSQIKVLAFRIAVPFLHQVILLASWKYIVMVEIKWDFYGYCSQIVIFSEHSAGFVIDLSTSGFLPVL